MNHVGELEQGLVPVLHHVHPLLVDIALAVAITMIGMTRAIMMIQMTRAITMIGMTRAITMAGGAPDPDHEVWPSVYLEDDVAVHHVEIPSRRVLVLLLALA